MGSNAVKKSREERLMSRAELARKAGISPQTLDRVERGKTCRLETKRKILYDVNIFTLSSIDGFVKSRMDTILVIPANPPKVDKSRNPVFSKGYRLRGSPE